MKHTTPAACALAALLLLTACTAPASPPPPAVTAGDQSAADTLQPPGESQEEFPVYYGTWTVTGQQAVSLVSALSPEEADAMTGLTVTYGAAVFSAPGEETLEDPVYTEAVTTAQALSADYSVSAADLGLPEGEISTLSVDNACGLGSFAVVRDPETLLFCLDGVWFTAVREK